MEPDQIKSPGELKAVRAISMMNEVMCELGIGPDDYEISSNLSDGHQNNGPEHRYTVQLKIHNEGIELQAMQKELNNLISAAAPDTAPSYELIEGDCDNVIEIRLDPEADVYQTEARVKLIYKP